MRETLVMPKLGESVTEGTVLKWLRRSGDRVKVDESVVEVETEKVNVEIPSSWEGELQIVAEEGETVPVGAPLAYIQTAAAATQAETGTPAPARELPTPKYLEQEQEVAAQMRRTSRYSPAVQALAREHNVELTQVQGTGIAGRITRNDVLKFIESRESAASLGKTAPQVVGAEELVPLTPTRRTIADRMTRSAQAIPHAWLMVEADVSDLVLLRHRAQHDFQRSHGTVLTYLPFVVQALAKALKEHPFLNSSWTDRGIVLKKEINIGVATATAEGLVVPVVRGADALAIAQLATRLADLTERARTRRLVIEEVQGGTFTLDNTGALGSIMSAPIINHPQAAILTFEAIVARPVVRGAALEVRQIANLCLSFDHRVVDGAYAAAFLKSVKQGLEAIRPDAAME